MGGGKGRIELGAFVILRFPRTSVDTARIDIVPILITFCRTNRVPMVGDADVVMREASTAPVAGQDGPVVCFRPQSVPVDDRVDLILASDIRVGAATASSASTSIIRAL
jgi:hypothetical protein